jgi:hypothetical protein
VGPGLWADADAARAVAESGIPFKPTAYQVRHTHASWLIDAAQNPELAELLAVLFLNQGCDLHGQRNQQFLPFGGVHFGQCAVVPVYGLEAAQLWRLLE